MTKNSLRERKCGICSDPFDQPDEAAEWCEQLNGQVRSVVEPLERELEKANVCTSGPAFWYPDGTVSLRFEDIEDCETFLNIISDPHDPESFYNCIRNGADEEGDWMFDVEYEDLGFEVDEDGNEEPGGSSPDFHAYPYVIFPVEDLPKVIERLKAHNRAPAKRKKR